jgi:hypothetical protein
LNNEVSEDKKQVALNTENIPQKPNTPTLNSVTSPNNNSEQDSNSEDFDFFGEFDSLLNNF